MTSSTGSSGFDDSLKSGKFNFFVFLLIQIWNLIQAHPFIYSFYWIDDDD